MVTSDIFIVMVHIAYVLDFLVHNYNALALSHGKLSSKIHLTYSLSLSHPGNTILCSQTDLVSHAPADVFPPIPADMVMQVLVASSRRLQYHPHLMMHDTLDLGDEDETTEYRQLNEPGGSKTIVTPNNESLPYSTHV